MDRRRGTPALLLLVLALALGRAAGVSAAAPEPPSGFASRSDPTPASNSGNGTSGFPGRFWFKGGLSNSVIHSEPWKPNGYALDAGLEFDHLISPTIGVGFEHHPSGQPDEVFASNFLGHPLARRTGGGDHRVISTSAGVRLRAPMAALEASLEGGFGLAWVSWRTPRYLDSTTGVLLQPEYRVAWNGVMGEWGLSIRTRRARGLDYSFGVRQRGYSEVFNFESAGSGSSVQVQLGILTP